MGLSKGAPAVGGLILFGTFTSLAAKIVYELDGVGRAGQVKNFEKPWAMTTVMFLGMTFCLPLSYYNEWQQKRRVAAAASAATEPLLGGNLPPAKPAHSELKQVLLLSIPTFFDLVATVLMNVGLLSVTASVYQMMRGAEMLFAALFAVVFLGRRLNTYHFAGIACCVVGICLVGLSSTLAGEGSASHQVSRQAMITGMALIISSQCVQAAQVTFEDFFMADMAVPPLKIVGYEGLFGAATMLLVLLPIVQRLPGKDGEGIHEDSVDTWHMVTHSSTIAMVLLADMLALLMYNVSGMCVTGHLGAVFRTVLETTRTLFVWLVDLVLYYTPLGMGKLGESWSSYSLLQAAGFAVLVSGTIIYGKGDEKEIAEEIAGGMFDADLAAGEESEAQLPGVPPTVPSLLGVAATTSMPIAVAGSLKSTMNMATFSAFSLPNSLSRSLRTRVRPIHPSQSVA